MPLWNRPIAPTVKTRAANFLFPGPESALPQTDPELIEQLATSPLVTSSPTATSTSARA
jgi:hypothetical protein